MTLYLVWHGSYSDTELLGIYSTMEKAQEAHEQFNADNDIEEMELDVMPKHPPGMVRWQVAMKKDGSPWLGKYDKVPVNRAGAYPDGLEARDYYPGYDWDRIEVHHQTAFVNFFVWARDAEHAVKVANERRVQLIATNEWTDDYEAWTARLRKSEKEVS